MSVNATPDARGQPLNLAGGRGTRIPDLHLLLAVHAARQAAGKTARLMRAPDLPVAAGDEPDRLALIFAPAGTGPAVLREASGSFNAAVAALMAVGTDGEGGVYRGA